MAIQVADNFQYLGQKPLDARVKYATVADMAAVAASNLYDGIMAYVVATEKNYQWKSTNEVDQTLGKWREFESGGGASADGKAESSAIAPVFDDTETYAAGDRVMYEDELYVFNTAHTGAWDADDVDPDVVMDEVPAMMSQADVDAIKGAIEINPYVEPFEKMTDSDVSDIKNAFVINRQFAGLTIGIGGGYAPLGTINFFDATVAPQDWLACDGSVYNIADYPQLAEWYATQHGASNFYGGDGTTTFAVPDLQGEFLRGTGTNSHANQGSGAAVGEHQDGTEHPYILTQQDGYVSGTRGSNNPFKYDSALKSADGRVYVTAQQDNVQIFNGNMQFTSRPTNTSFLICVKAVVAGEVYSTEERVVGTWIDGKKIYQKTVYISSFPNNADSTYPHGISNIDVVLNVFGFAVSSSMFFNLPYVEPSTESKWYIALNSDRTNIKIKTGSDRSTLSGYVTLQYTKTTDG